VVEKGGWGAGSVNDLSPEQLRIRKAYLFSKLRVDRGKKGLVPYTPHDAQMEVHFPASPWTYAVLPWGARSGKSVSAAAEIVGESSLPKTRNWIVAPTYVLADKVFDYVYEWIVLQQVLDDPLLLGRGSVVRASRTKDQRRIELSNGSWIEGKSADSPNSLVGEQLDLIVFDECARCDEKIWLEYLEARTLDRRGRTMFISTPRGFNWFRAYYFRGQDPEMKKKGWMSKNMKTIDNPFLDKDFIERKRSETPEAIWKQEYEGDFSSMAGLVWPDYRDTLWRLDGPKGHLYDPKEVDLDDATWYRAIDIGTRHPTACLWGAVTREQDLFISREYEATNPIHEVHAESITALTSEKIATTYISPDARRKSGITTSHQQQLCPMDIYKRAGIYARPASDNVSAGISEVARYLRATLEDSPAHPRVFISRECSKLRESLQSYIYHETLTSREIDAPDRPRKYKDHLPDAFRYLLATTPRYRSFWMEQEEYEPVAQGPRIKGMAHIPAY
jgi:hypothetical protein